jgi:PmbA protein
MSKLIEKIINKGATEAEIVELDKVVREITFENNQLKAVKTSQNSGLALRTVVDHKMGFTSSTNVDDLDKVVDNAISVSKFSGPKEFNFSSPSEYENMELTNNKIWEIEEEQLIEDGVHAIESLKKYDKEILTYLSFSKEKTKIKLENSNGVKASYEKDILGTNVFISLIDGTNFIYSGEFHSSLSEKYDLDSMLDKIKEKVTLLKQTPNFEPSNKNVILTPNAIYMIFLTLYAGLNGSMIEKGVSPLCGKIGEKVFDDRISIVDDGTLKNGIYTMPFDDEGTKTQRTVLFENGILKNYIHSLRTAEKLGYAPTGNGLKHARGSSIKALSAIQGPNISNWVMAPGTIAYEDMIKDIRDGVIIDEIMGIFTSNLVNGDFAGNIGTGYLIKDGKIVGRAKDAAINANIYQILNANLVGISDKVYNTDGHSFPYVMLKDIYIAGKK